MSKDKSEDQVFEVKRIAELIELMKEHELSEIDLRQDAKRIRLKRGPDAPMMMAMPPMGAAPIAQAPAGTGAVAGGGAAEATEDDNAIYITSPTVGTFYSKPKPDAKTFVKVGDVVSPDTVVCLVEAMKMYNEIPAGVSGKIIACLVNNEDPVDVNKQLFKVEPA